jgi:hypothetical protein
MEVIGEAISGRDSDTLHDGQIVFGNLEWVLFEIPRVDILCLGKEVLNHTERRTHL